MPAGGLQPGAQVSDDDSDDECAFFVLFFVLCVCYSRYFGRDPEDNTAKMRRAVRANNFTQQTNALDVDKHMYVFFVPFLYIAHSQMFCAQVGVHRGEDETPPRAFSTAVRPQFGRGPRRE